MDNITVFWKVVILIVVIAIVIVIAVVIISQSYHDSRGSNGNHGSRGCRTYPKELIHSRLYTMLQLLDENFIRNDVFYMVTGGTLLGAVREGKIIDHDDDVDIDVFGDQIPDILRILGELCKDGQYKYVKTIFGYKFVDTETYTRHQDNGAQVDIFIRNGNDSHLRYVHPMSCKLWKTSCTVDKQLVFPIKRGKIGNVDINLPQSPEAILTQVYDRWDIPVVYNHNRIGE